MENINGFWIQETEIQDQDWRIEMEEYSYSSMTKQEEPGTCQQNIQKERCQKDAKRVKGRRKGASNEREELHL